MFSVKGWAPTPNQPVGSAPIKQHFCITTAVPDAPLLKSSSRRQICYQFQEAAAENQRPLAARLSEGTSAGKPALCENPSRLPSAESKYCVTKAQRCITPLSSPALQPFILILISLPAKSCVLPATVEQLRVYPIRFYFFF